MFFERKEFSRRGFLAHGIGVVTGVCTGASLTSCRYTVRTPVSKPNALTRFGFTTYQWGQDWDIPTLIANCSKARAFGVELRTSRIVHGGVEYRVMSTDSDGPGAMTRLRCRAI